VSVLTLAYCAWIGYVVVRILRDRLPRPADIVTLSLFFYNVPLALVALVPGIDDLTGNLAFLNPVAGDVPVAEKTVLITAIATLALGIGRWLGSRLKRPKSPRRPIQLHLPLQRTAVLLMIVAVVAIVGGIGIFGAEVFFSGYAAGSQEAAGETGEALIYFSHEVMGLAFFVWCVCSMNTHHTRGRLAVLSCLAFLMLVTVLRGKRLELIVALLPALLLWWSTRLVRVWQRVAAVGCIALAVAVLASVRLGESPNVASVAFNLFSEGLYAGHMTPGVIDAVQRGEMKLEYGGRFLVAVLALVPRMLMPAKDELVYRTITDLTPYAPLGASSFLAEVFLQGEVIGVVICFLLIGFGASRLEMRSLTGHRGLLSLRAVAYVLFVCSFVPHFRDGIVPSLKIPVQLLVVVLLLVSIGGAWARVRRARRSSGGVLIAAAPLRLPAHSTVPAS